MADLQIRPLSIQQARVMEYISQGFQQKQIAIEMRISVNTVRYHVYRAYRNLGVRNVAEAATKFQKYKTA